MNKYHYRYNYYNSNNYKCNINTIKKMKKYLDFIMNIINILSEKNRYI